MDKQIDSILRLFIPKMEGFTPRAKWDEKQWSWGYGTAAGYDPKVTPKGSITRDKALTDMIAHFTKDYDVLEKKVTRALLPNQWAAFLSFSFNEGVGNAENLLDDINSDSSSLEHHLKKYVYAGGAVNKDLIKRREKEWNLWNNQYEFK